MMLCYFEIFTVIMLNDAVVIENNPIQIYDHKLLSEIVLLQKLSFNFNNFLL